MGTSVKDLARTTIGILADATGDPYLRMGLGLPGSSISAANTTEETGQAFEPEPRALGIIVEGLALALGNLRYIDDFINNSGVTIPSGRLVRMSGNSRFTMATDASSGLIGVTAEAVNHNQSGLLAVHGVATLQLLGALSPSAGDLLYASSTAGVLTTAGVLPLAVVTDNSEYAGDQTVKADLRFPAV